MKTLVLLLLLVSIPAIGLSATFLEKAAYLCVDGTVELKKGNKSVDKWNCTNDQPTTAEINAVGADQTFIALEAAKKAKRIKYGKSRKWLIDKILDLESRIDALESQ